LLGGKALSLGELVKQRKRNTVLGTSISFQAPTGEYFSDKLVNLGTNRWAFKPEIALSQPIGKKWLMDLYSAVWVFTNNESYFTGDAKRSQQAIASFQWQISYNISAFAWAAFNATYYQTQILQSLRWAGVIRGLLENDNRARGMHLYLKSS
jgi:hypothetical protein